MSVGRLDELDRDECLRLLQAQEVGRVGLSIDALPVVLPVHYVVSRGRILFRTGEGGKLRAALRNAVVCFEVDEVDAARREGWSVVVTGTARELGGASAAEVESLPLEPWMPAAGDHVVAISVDLVSGRRLARRPEAAC